MARLFWLVLMLAFVGVLLAAASWAVAYNSVGGFLGAPPPKMGTQHTSVQWHGFSQLRDHPPEWRFSYGPTVIPGASSVRIYVNPWGRIVATEPRDLEARLVAFRRPAY